MFEVTFKNAKTGEYYKEVSPVIVKTTDEAEALTKIVDPLKQEYEDIAKIIAVVYEDIVNNETNGMQERYNIVFTDSSRRYAEIVSDNHGILIRNYTLDVTEETQFRNIIKFLKDEIRDIYMTNIISQMPNSIQTTLSNAMGIGNNKFNNMNSNSSVDEIIESINTQTKGHVSKPNLTLQDYVCEGILKEELNEIKEFMENYETYINLNIEIPKGILFKGAPGTGKTYAAKCIAGSTDCYFISCTASSLQGMYIGSGSQNIRELFMGAKALQKASNKGIIIFIDEVDSLGSRNTHTGGAGGEEDRTVNQLLAEMDGFEDTTKIMVMAATNYANRLDDALLRSGRFSRQINIPYPTEEERRYLSEFYFKKIKMDLENTTYDEIASLTYGLSPADIKEIANESAILTIRYKCNLIKLDYINEAINKCITKNIRNKDNQSVLNIVTAHECGHVLAEYLYEDSVATKVTNYSYGDAGGFTQPSFRLEGIISRDKFINNIKILLAGRAAEEVICGTITNGASNDLEKSKNIILNYYKTYVFEKYEVKELEQTVINDLNDLYEEVVKDFKDKKDLLQKLIDALNNNRVLYKKDIAILLGANIIIPGGSIL